MLFAELAQAKLEPSMEETANALLAAKKSGDEHCTITRVPELDSWIVKVHNELYERARASEAPRKISWDVLDEVFLQLVR